MATSGSFNTNKEGNFYCTVSWNRTGYDSAKNEHYISYKVVAHNTAGKYRSVYGKELTINNNRVYYNTTSKSFYDGDTVTSGNITIKSSNNAGDGSITMNFRAGVGTSSSYNISGSQTWSLNRIPRYATSNQTLSSKTETTINMNWSSDSIVDYIWYSTNNGSSWTGINVTDGTSGSYSITGLSANTTYNIKTRVRRKDSQLTTDSSALAVTTYSYPYANSMPDFTIGSALTIGIYNPLKRSVQITIVGADNREYGSDTITGTSITGYNNSTWQSWWYSTIPNSKTGTYKVKVTYSGHVETRTGGTYTVNENECKPDTGTFAYQDTNAATIAITGNNHLLIQNNSTLQITIANAEANKFAYLNKATINVNGNIINKNFESGTHTVTFDVGTVNFSGSLIIPITITDTRGITNTANLRVIILEWSLPSAIINLERVANFYSTTNILVNAEYSSLMSQNTLTIQYQIKKVTDASYGALSTLQDNVQSQFEANNLYEWDVKVILTDRLGTTTYNLKLSKGMPIVFFDNFLNSTGFNCFPKDQESVEVSGVNIMEKNIMTAGMSSNLTLSSTGDVKIPLNRIKAQVGNKLSISNNRINIGQGISYVKVNCQIYVNRSSGAGGAFNLNIRKNGYEIATATNSGVASGGNKSDNLSNILISVQQGDYIEFYFYGYSGDVVRYEQGTYITVEVVN